MTNTTNPIPHPIVLDGTIYDVARAGEQCYCHRCLICDDPGGCLVAEALYGLITWMCDPVGTYDLFGPVAEDLYLARAEQDLGPTPAETDTAAFSQSFYPDWEGEAEAARWDDDPSPYDGTYSEC